MSRGKPVVGSAVGGIVDMVKNEETGLLVSPGDVPGLTAAMTRLLDDPELCARLGAQAREATAEITADSVAMEFETLYASATA
jgi:glycosyltransferase involved in cell wall biosynthesis